MNARVLVVLATALTAAPALCASEPPSAYGEALRLETATPIAEILADPRSFAGRRVRVEGEVEGVCPMKGCWMNLRQGEDVVRIKVEDDVIVFPSDAVGGNAVAEGVVELQELTREQYVAWHAHLAEELGRELDPDAVGEGPYTLVQIRGEGAVVERP